MSQSQTIRIECQPWARFLYARDGSIRRKGLYGGRGSGKSYSMAEACIVLGAVSRTRVMCLREKQTAIRDSSWAELVAAIQRRGLGAGYNITNEYISHANGSYFLFKGLWLNDEGIKSTQGVDIAWVDEAQNVSQHSWEVLDPTIREANSEIWASWNPQLDTDPTHLHWLVNPPPKTVTKKVNWEDNLWLPEVLREQAEHDRRTDPKKYDHVWAGNCKPAVEGAIYEDQLRLAEEEGRIGTVGYVQGAPVHTAWDLGWGDMTSVWLWQHVGTQIRIIGYREGRQRTIVDFVREMQQLPYVWGIDYLPWDGGKKDVGSGLGVDDRLIAVGRKPFVVAQEAVYTGIDAVRTLFPSLAFDAGGCADGLAHLRRYAWAIRSDGNYQREPKHDEHSHAGDALRTLAMGIRPARPEPVSPRVMVGGGRGVRSVWT